jgi:hypothetical protein
MLETKDNSAQAKQRKVQRNEKGKLGGTEIRFGDRLAQHNADQHRTAFAGKTIISEARPIRTVPIP